LASVNINAGNIATYINTLKKTIFSFIDQTSYPEVEKLIFAALPFIENERILSDFNELIDFLFLQTTFLTAHEKRTLELAFEHVFKQLVGLKVDNSNPNFYSKSKTILASGVIQKANPLTDVKGSLINIWPKESKASAPTYVIPA